MQRGPTQRGHQQLILGSLPVTVGVVNRPLGRGLGAPDLCDHPVHRGRIDGDAGPSGGDVE
jgi:hypothetical protein